jgi:hypothetical protein
MLPLQIPPLIAFAALFLIALVAGFAWALGAWLCSMLVSYRRPVAVAK